MDSAPLAWACIPYAGWEEGLPHPRFKDVCIRDVREMDIDIARWEDVANDRPQRRRDLRRGLDRREEKRSLATEETHDRWRGGKKATSGCGERFHNHSLRQSLPCKLVQP